jgi:hypothetical protein
MIGAMLFAEFGEFYDLTMFFRHASPSPARRDPAYS